MFLRRILLPLTLAAFTLGACGSTSPQMKVLGVTQAKKPSAELGADNKILVVFVEVVNRSTREIQLSGLEYELAADSWFTTQGRVALSRSLAAKSTAVVEIHVPFQARESSAAEIAYSLKGRLFARDERIERSWKVRADGTIEAGRISVGSPRILTNIAAVE